MDTPYKRGSGASSATPTKVKKPAAKKGGKRGTAAKNESDGDDDMPDDWSESPVSPLKEENYEL